MHNRFFVAILCLLSACAQGRSSDLTPLSGADGKFEALRHDGRTVWRAVKLENGNYAPYLYFQAPPSSPAGVTYYVRVEFKDVGAGWLGLEYNATGDRNYQSALRGSGRLLRNTGADKVAVFELADAAFRHAQNLSADFRLVGARNSAPLTIISASLLTQPPPEYRAHTAKPWLDPYNGPRRNDVDASSLQGKVLCGYQGWFRAPGDPSDGGWGHWSNNQGRIASETLTFDMWPDMAEYQKTYPADQFKQADGTQAYLFSSADPETIDLHFDWMRDYGIDGVVVQQFLVSFNKPDATRVLGWVRNAANRTGRVFTIEFDMSQFPPEKAVSAMQEFWRRLVDEMKITDDPRYVHQDGKPVLIVFGFYQSRFSSQTANQIVDLFKQPGRYQAYLVGSGTWAWRAEKDPEWARVFRRFDAMLPWNTGNTWSKEGVVHAQTGTWADDLAESKRNHMLFIPEIYPGFSWNNLMHTTSKPTGIPRRGGDFYREQFQKAKDLGIDSAYVGMFDEVDEGTAIFKVTDTPPRQGYFATMEGKPSDFYLRLTGEGTRLLRKKMVQAASVCQSGGDIVFADFEGSDFGAWKADGTAFGSGPAHGHVPPQGPVSGYIGKGFADSYHGGEVATGTLTSPAFKIERRYVSFLIGGGWEMETRIDLLVDGKAERSAGAMHSNGEELTPGSWDVADLAGKTARIQIVDNATGPWGHINIDQIVFTDTKPPALLIDPKLEIQAEKRWLYFPLKDTGSRNIASTRVKVTCDGKVVREFMAELAADSPNWWCPLDISEWKGRKLTIEVRKMLDNAVTLQLIHQSDEWEGADQLYREALRPQFHFTTRRGWTNDPNGMAYYNGEYHLFFQHDPFCRWGNGAQHWGHAVGKDLVHWEELGEAIYPDAKGRIWSGSGVVDLENTSGLGKDGKPPLVLFYTYTNGDFVQCMTYSTDGRTFTNYTGNPVVKNVSRGNRDPKVFWHEPTRSWIMAFYAPFGNDDKTVRHTLQLYKSKNLRDWKALCEIEGGTGGDHFLAECPDIYPIALDGDPARTKWVLTAANDEYKIGMFDGGKFIAETPKLSGNHGNAFYAAQTFNNEPNGRRIQIGWSVCFVPEMPFNQGMSVPLEVLLRGTPDGPRLAFWPVKELESLRRNSRTLQPGPLKPGDNPLAGIAADAFDLEATIAVGKAKSIVFDLRGTTVTIDPSGGFVSCEDRRGPVSLKDGLLRLRILVDRMSLEIFANDGLLFMPMHFVANPGDRSLKLSAEGGEANIVSLKLHDMAGIWPGERPPPPGAPSRPTPTRADVSYGSHPHQLMDIYAPKEGAGPFPAVLWYGGIWASDKNVPDLNQFHPHGVAVISVETRGMGDATKAGIKPPISVVLLDARRALQFVRMHASEWKLDPERIGVAGGSQAAIPSLYVACAGEMADSHSADPLERISTKVVCAGSYRGPGSIDPKRLLEWVPGDEWGAPSLGCSFAESLRRRDELLPIINRWSPEALMTKNTPPIYIEYDWGLTKPDSVKEMDYKIHSPMLALGFQKMAQAQGVPCYVRFPGHPSEKYNNLWDFLVKELTQPAKPR